MSKPSASSRPPVLAIGALLAAILGVALTRRWLDVVEVVGDSMAPTLLPGDLLLVESWSLRRREPLCGEVVLAPDPRWPARVLVKRVAAVGDGHITLRGDNQSASTDSATFGSVPASSARWRVAARCGRTTRAPNPARSRPAAPTGPIH